jgi:hypothetical protein
MNWAHQFSLDLATSDIRNLRRRFACIGGRFINLLRLFLMVMQDGRFFQELALGHIDLSPLMIDPAAARILMLARGQLNRAFRTHGLMSPDPLPVDDRFDIDPQELDDPAALGVETASKRFKDHFLMWSNRIPLTLARPVLDILQQTYRALGHQPNDTNGAGATVLKAYDFLLERWKCNQDLASDA